MSTTKNQIIVDARQEGGSSWVDFESQHKAPAAEEIMENMPCLDDDDDSQFVSGVGGDSDPSGGVTITSLNNGFTKKNMPQDYSVYGIASDIGGEDIGGFAERGNYMDRM